MGYKPCVVESEIDVLTEVLHENKLSGNGIYGKRCSHWLEYNLACERVLLTPSCTAALEMTALLMNISEGDEVIMPSYTFVSTAVKITQQRQGFKIACLEEIAYYLGYISRTCYQPFCGKATKCESDIWRN